MLFEPYGRNMVIKTAHFSLAENNLVMHLVMGIWPKATHQGLCFYLVCGSSTVVVLAARILLPHGHKVAQWFLTQLSKGN